MELSGEAIILSVHKFAEHGAVVRLLGREEGVYAGVCKHALSSRQRGTYQVGNRVHAHWRARLQEHLGTLDCEMITPVAALAMQDAHALAALASACQLVQSAIEERDPHPALYDALRELLMQMALGERWHEDYVRFELLLLAEAGFGLDLSSCAATGQIDELTYVSPKSGGAVCREAGAPYRQKLLPLPGFLLHPMAQADRRALDDGLRLTGHFLHHWLLAPHGRKLPHLRERLTQAFCAAPQEEIA